MSLAALEAGLGEVWPFETFPEYLDAIERRGTAINIGVMSGHTPVRLHVMGEAAVERAATDDEIARMAALVREAMATGALGFATSTSPIHVGYAGKPVPSRLAEDGEMTALGAALAASGHGVFHYNGSREPAFAMHEALHRVVAVRDQPLARRAVAARRGDDHGVELGPRQAHSDTCTGHASAIAVKPASIAAQRNVTYWPDSA